MCNNLMDCALYDRALQAEADPKSELLEWHIEWANSINKLRRPEDPKMTAEQFKADGFLTPHRLKSLRQVRQDTNL